MKRWKPWLGQAGAIVLALVLLTAAIAKTVEPGPLVDQVRIEGLDFLLSAPQVALLAIALEATLGVGLLIGLRRLWILIPTGFLTVFFLLLTGRNYWLVSQGLREEGGCGCFGTWLERSPAEALWQDFLLLVPALIVALWGRAKGRERFLAPRLLAMAILPLLLVISVLRGTDFHYMQAAERIASAGTTESVSQFHRSHQYVLLVDKVPRPDSGVYQSEHRVELLLLTPVLDGALLLHPGEGSVYLVSRQQLRSGPGDTLYLDQDVQLQLSGPFETDPQGIVFVSQGHRLLLRPPSG